LPMGCDAFDIGDPSAGLAIEIDIGKHRGGTEDPALESEIEIKHRIVRLRADIDPALRLVEQPRPSLVMGPPEPLEEDPTLRHAFDRTHEAMRRKLCEVGWPASVVQCVEVAIHCRN